MEQCCLLAIFTRVLLLPHTLPHTASHCHTVEFVATAHSQPPPAPPPFFCQPIKFSQVTCQKFLATELLHFEKHWQQLSFTFLVTFSFKKTGTFSFSLSGSSFAVVGKMYEMQSCGIYKRMHLLMQHCFLSCSLTHQCTICSSPFLAFVTKLSQRPKLVFRGPLPTVTSCLNFNFELFLKSNSLTE